MYKYKILICTILIILFRKKVFKSFSWIYFDYFFAKMHHLLLNFLDPNRNIGHQSEAGLMFRLQCSFGRLHRL